MTQSELSAVVARVIGECEALLGTKGKDYSDYKGDRLSNFKEGADMSGTTVIQTWAIYFFKHFAAISRYVKDGQVYSEPIEGRINDAINYLILLRALIEEAKYDSNNGK